MTGCDETAHCVVSLQLAKSVVAIVAKYLDRKAIPIASVRIILVKLTCQYLFHSAICGQFRHSCGYNMDI